MSRSRVHDSITIRGRGGISLRGLPVAIIYVHQASQAKIRIPAAIPTPISISEETNIPFFARPMVTSTHVITNNAISLNVLLKTVLIRALIEF